MTVSSSPWRIAATTAARRPRTPSFVQALRRWKFTVLSLTSRMRAVSQLVLPAADQNRQMAWRSDRGLAADISLGKGADSEVSGEIGGCKRDKGGLLGNRSGQYADSGRLTDMAAMGGAPCS